MCYFINIVQRKGGITTSQTYKNDLTGQRFGRLVALHHVKTEGPKTYWLCRCDCGKETLVGYGELCSGNTKSCGCLHDERAAEHLRKLSKKHGMFGTRIYNIWSSMKKRCKTNPHYANVKICDDWLSFEPFYNWAMVSGYSDELTIDRINVYGNYEPSNCRWATPKQQSDNKTTTVYLTVNGTTKTVTQWAEETGLKRATIKYRIHSGWPEDRLLLPPTR